MSSFLVPIFVFVAVICLGGSVLMFQSARKQPIRDRIDNLDQANAPSTASDAGRQWLKTMGGIGEFVSAKGASPKIRLELTKAGFYDRSAPAVYLGVKMVLFFGGLGGLLVLLFSLNMSTTYRVLLTFIGSGLLFFVPNIYLQVRCQNRSSEVRNYLPDVIDLLQVCVSGGMGLDAAWNSVGEEIRTVSSLLADEMALTNLEMHLGADRATAMEHMMERTGVDDIASLASVLVQSERFGTSVSDALRTFAASLREIRSQRAEESAEKMAIKMLFPMVIFIFPVVFIVAIGPACINIYAMLIRGYL